MKEKQLTITSSNITQKQWSNLILELNLIKKAWSSYATVRRNFGQIHRAEKCRLI